MEAFLPPAVTFFPNTPCSSHTSSLLRPLRPSRRPRNPSVTVTVASSSSTPSTSLSSSPPDTRRLLPLQNGSDVRGVSSTFPSTPWTEPITLTPSHAFLIGHAFAVWVARRTEKEPREVAVSLGRDSRVSGPVILRAAAAGMASAGVVELMDFGMATTPAMFMSTITEGWDCAAAVMVTASHLPPNRNGIKFFTKEGGTRKQDVKEILQIAMEVESSGKLGAWPYFTDDTPFQMTHRNFMEVYAAQLRRLIQEGCNHPTNYEKPLAGLRILVDAGNGAGGFFATDVLAPLGADTTGSQFLDPDGMFPNHVPNPEDKTAMKMTTDATVANAADLGIIFDTDVDRSAVVDATGEGINRNKLIALMAAVVLREHPGTTVLTDSVTSNGLSKFIATLGGRHFRYRRGYKNVIDKGVELNLQGEECWLAIETSGHGAMRENYFLDDGAYLAVKTVIELVRLRLASPDAKPNVATLLDSLSEPLEEREIRIKFRDPEYPDFKSLANQVLEDFRQFAETEVSNWTLETENYEGYRVRVAEGAGQEGWLLLRKSLHDPLLPLNIESETVGGVQRVIETLRPFLSRYDFLDVSPFQ